MESTKSQLVLRSMDMDGRSLGTERSSTFLGGRSQAAPVSTVAQAVGVGDRFAALLGERASRDVTQVASAVAARIREGRTDAANQTYNARDAQAKTWKPREERSFGRDSSEGVDAGAQGAGDRSKADPASTGKSADGAGPIQDDAATADSQGAEELEAAQADALPEADPSDVPGQAAPHSLPLAPTGPMGSSSVLATGANPTAVAPTMALASGGAALAAGTAASTGPKVATNQPSQSIQPATAAKAARRAEGTTAPRQGLPAEEARALLDQVRIQILDGKREARIQLRPIELGRLDLLIRVDGKAVTAKIAAESPETLAVLEAHAPELRAWLARDGAESVELEFTSIDPDSTEFAHGDGAAEEGSGAGGEARRSRSGASRGAGGFGEPDSAERSALLHSITRRVPDGAVDFMA